MKHSLALIDYREFADYKCVRVVEQAARSLWQFLDYLGRADALMKLLTVLDIRIGRMRRTTIAIFDAAGAPSDRRRILWHEPLL
jgi:hypothetical protein